MNLRRPAGRALEKAESTLLGLAERNSFRTPKTGSRDRFRFFTKCGSFQVIACIISTGESQKKDSTPHSRNIRAFSGSLTV